MRDRRARVLLLALIFAFPVLIDAAASRRGRAESPANAAGPARPIEAGVAPRVFGRVEAVEAVLAAGLTFAGWQRRRLLGH